MDKNKSDVSDDYKKDAQNDEIKSVIYGRNDTSILF